MLATYMNKYGEKYERKAKLPDNARAVSLYATEKGQRNPAYICVKYDRYLKGVGEYPGYIIINYQGRNYVIPD